MIELVEIKIPGTENNFWLFKLIIEKQDFIYVSQIFPSKHVAFDNMFQHKITWNCI